MSGVRQHTRIVESIEPDDLIQCTICDLWLPAEENFAKFGSRKRSDRVHPVSAAYAHRCTSCNTLRNSMRVMVDGRLRAPKLADVRAAAQGGAAADQATLNYVGHVTRSNPRDLSDAEIVARKILREARAEREGQEGFVYMIGEAGAGWSEFPRYVKIGHSVDPEARVGELQTGNPRKLKLLAKVPGDRGLERQLHNKYIANNVIGEWFFNSFQLLSEFDLHPERVSA